MTDQGATHSVSWKRSALRWLPTFFGFPLGGFIAEHVSGPVDSLTAALLGGLITGLVLGAGQAWGLGPVGPSARGWIVGTGLGFAVGLGVGAAAVDYGTSMGDLAVQGAICGVTIGAVQAFFLRPQLGRLAYGWPAALAATWALGWTVTTAIGVDVEAQYTVFGSSGALTVTVLTAALPALLASRAESTAS